MLGATKALILGDEDEARAVIRVHDDLTVRTVEAEASALQLLVRHEGDLRDVAVSLQTVADDHGLSQGLIESTNTKIRVLTRVAFGFHSAEALIALAMLALGGHRPALPGRA